MTNKLSNLSRQEETALILKELANNGSFAEYCIAIDRGYQLEWFHEEVARKLEQGYKRLLAGEDVRIMFFMPPRHGKLIAHSTPVITPNGWQLHGDLAVGDYVYHPSGKAIKVLGTSTEDQATLKVTFSNGESLTVHPNHEWTVYDRQYKKFRTLETNYFIKQTKFGKAKKLLSGNRCMYQLPNIQAIECSEKELPLQPYFFGAWLGDGSSCKPAITSETKDIAIIDNCAYQVTNTHVHSATKVPTYYFSHQKIVQTLKELNCYGNKHIPEVYKRSSIEQRLQLLAGLVDTDGSTDKNSRVRIVTVSKVLANDIAELVTSLGMRPYIMEQQPTLSTSGIQGKKVVYSVGFQPTMEIPVALARKAIKRIPKQKMIGIVSVEQVEPEQGRCIQVDSPDGLYLVGKTMLPTHNSDMTTQKFTSWVLGKTADIPIMVSSYSDELATDFGQRTRDIMQSPEYQVMFNTRLRPDAKAKGKWLTQNGGSYTAVGVGGALTGRGFKIGIIDDPFKNREEADSQVIRDSRHKWYQSTFSTREEGNSMIIFILTRWHADDLAGRVLKEAADARKNGEPADDWDIIQYKAIATEDEPQRKEGEALWPSKFPLDKLQAKKAVMGSYEFSALYQQNPVDEENRKFKTDWFKTRPYSEVAKLQTLNFMTIDPRGKDDIKQGKDYIGVTVNFVDREGNWNILSYRMKLSATQLIDLMFTFWGKYNLTKIGIEDNQFTQGLMVSINEQMRSRGTFFALELLKHGGTQKELRIESLVPRYEKGGIYHLTIDGQNQCTDLEEELLLFPKATNDDASDSLAFQGQIVQIPFDDDDSYTSGDVTTMFTRRTW